MFRPAGGDDLLPASAPCRQPQEQFLSALIASAQAGDDDSQPQATADHLLGRYHSLAGVFHALIDSLDAPYPASSLKADLARQLIALARSEAARPRIDGSLFSYLIQTLGHRADEALLALFLGPANTCIDVQILAYGGAHEVSLGTRRLLRAAVRCGATAFILAHNHPSGQPEPSTMDYQATRSAQEAARAIGVDLVDHLIVGREAIYSMRHAQRVEGHIVEGARHD
ncbi:JAB domain-containing protein [Novosphingobium rosa]|uniref:JAB domain-containing protein n=1 Tax=Novosphingobium rosa TaxID=76978 RepID=UPI0008302A18|nr:JAB domain-containing protein [Novosphingobium rosa]